MKTAKPPAQSDAASSSRRAQPVRQTRANPPRSSGLARSLPSAAAAAAATPRDQPIEIYPALTHFTDAITSLPKELVRQFTLLKEVDAKIFAPEEALFQMVDAAMIASAPEPQAQSQTQTQSQAPSREAGASTPISTNPSLNGQPSNGVAGAPSADDANSQQAAYAQENIHRRHLFRGVAFKIQEMLVSLEEKNHVITTANDALSKQLARVNDVWPHLEGEFSDEAKWGSTTHWAYPENRVSARNTQAERSRRDGAATITAAAQQLADEAAARSDARKQAVAAKKGLKGQAQNQANDHDHDDHETPNTKSKPDTKKSQAAAAKARKAADSSAAVGLGITSGTPQTNGNGSKKSKKSEANKTTGPAAAATATPAIGGQPMERAMSGVMASNGSTKAKTSSPRSTPAPETKKRKALPTTNGASKKRWALRTILPAYYKLFY